MKWIGYLLFMLMVSVKPAYCQLQAITPSMLFANDSIWQVTLTTDIKMLRSSKDHSLWQPATISLKTNDNKVITEGIKIRIRGNLRKTICDLATLELNCTNTTSPQLSALKRLKWVGGCHSDKFDEGLLVREYLVYKLYNQLSPLSFQTKMLQVTYNDSRGKMKPYTQYAFLIESVNDVASRNNCVEKKRGVYNAEATSRMQVTSVNIFEYMIGNTDYSIANRHNVKLLVPANDTLANPYVVPYDFDYAGIVNAPYAVPREELAISSVRVRSYRGFPRTEAEIDSLITVFKNRKMDFLKVLQLCPLLNGKAKEDMLEYVNSFYTLLDKDKSIKRAFITNARTY